MSSVRVRFAPSPTGPLHIGGVRTALYNYLFAKKNNGTFILRIEDTDQARYVGGAEEYIINTLKWFNLIPQEGPGFGGSFGPYRQSERKDLYKSYVEKLLSDGHAYFSFDTSEELDALREIDPTFKYDHKSRKNLKNSLSLSTEETEYLLENSDNVSVRLKINPGERIEIEDHIRGLVVFDSDELDDKVILKSDGMPTYHLANIIDDHLMQITHVIRGEEWLSSTAHHVILYRYYGWSPPTFAHLPLILKPTGQGKLSKRDGAKFGFPVFPLQWKDNDEVFKGFKEEGFLPEAVLNFLSLLGWNSGTDQEIFSIEELVSVFSLEKIVKSGAKFDIEKAKWFNQQYIIHTSNENLANLLFESMKDKYQENYSLEYLAKVCGLMKERVYMVEDILKSGSFFFKDVLTYDEEVIVKKFKIELVPHFKNIADIIEKGGDAIEAQVKMYINDQKLKMGDIFPILRIAISGTMQGPDLFQTMTTIGNQKSSLRLNTGLEKFISLV